MARAAAIAAVSARDHIHGLAHQFVGHRGKPLHLVIGEGDVDDQIPSLDPAQGFQLGTKWGSQKRSES